MFEAKAPGAIAGTTMFSGTSSNASRLVRMNQPHFRCRIGIGILDIDREAVDRGDVDDRRRRCWLALALSVCSNAWIRKNGDLTFRSITLSQPLSGNVSISARSAAFGPIGSDDRDYCEGSGANRRAATTAGAASPAIADNNIRRFRR